ncbi:hypothetical protein [Microtetraspora fusca]|uniref:Uncharacterized protein n=1 Tax=Microtetraspora fusca TaxID=1997 RepID=A0ABW6V9K2_MICFU|nr:hypothetical protein [Microtetraspora fusca]
MPRFTPFVRLGVAALAALGLTLSATPANAAGSLRLTQIKCNETSDTWDPDKPYFVVFVASTSNPTDTTTVLVDPGLDVYSGKTYNLSKTITSSNASTVFTATVMVEQDEGRDIDSTDLAYIRTAMHNTYQLNYWTSNWAAMRDELRRQVDDVLAGGPGGDDILGANYRKYGVGTTPSPMVFQEDGGDYSVQFSW